MKALCCALLLFFGGLGCARIYRPVTLVSPSRGAAPTEGLSGGLTPQPWGDNSRYEKKAQAANLRVLVLELENPSAEGTEVLRLELPEGVTALSAQEAAHLVRQYSAAHLLYPLIPALLAAASSDGGGAATIGPTPAMVFGAMALVGLLVGLPNMGVAERSNRRLEEFFLAEAWSPGRLEPGQTRRGLIFLRGPDLRAPLQIRVISRGGSGERALELTCPGSPPL
ncbi:MAG: hypothetical protein HGB30_03710 [Holophagaceae bacterium]|nr:hypothetical protein [Holophagaceae bacterium]